MNTTKGTYEIIKTRKTLILSRLWSEDRYNARVVWKGFFFIVKSNDDHLIGFIIIIFPVKSSVITYPT